MDVRSLPFTEDEVYKSKMRQDEALIKILKRNLVFRHPDILFAEIVV